MKAQLRIGLLVLLFLMVCFECVAQNGLVLKTQDLPSKNTIIRTWNVEHSIGYSDDGAIQGYFFLEDIVNKHFCRK